MQYKFIAFSNFFHNLKAKLLGMGEFAWTFD